LIRIGVAGVAGSNPFVPRSAALPMPPVRPFRMGELFRTATEAMGLHPYPTPVAVNSVPYNGFSAITYCAWSGGFGPFNDERWHPGLTWVPEALATGFFDLRTHCRVVRVLTDADGHASGVEYVDANGCWQVQAGPHRHPVRLHLRERAATAAFGRRASPERAGQQCGSDQ
jgi:gluconate 2-dehydrogenase alpha chain